MQRSAERVSARRRARRQQALGLFPCLAIVGGVTREDLGAALGQVPLPGHVVIAAAQALLLAVPFLAGGMPPRERGVE